VTSSLLRHRKTSPN